MFFQRSILAKQLEDLVQKIHYTIHSRCSEISEMGFDVLKKKSCHFTGKSLPGALIFASTNPQYDKIVHGITMNNLLSYCGLVDARISASEKDLPVQGKC